MELELGLALPSGNAPAKGLSFDLNGGDAYTTAATAAVVHKSKRGFTEAFGGSDVDARATLPLFLWASARDDDGHNNSGDGGCARRSEQLSSGGYGGTAPVGWPPVKSAWRNAGATRYVKVKMEGVAIGRKVDLTLHRSYATLLDAVDRLFTRNHEEETGHPALRHRRFIYQVGNGDWMLLGDAPWETFVKSVKRLKILSCGE